MKLCCANVPIVVSEMRIRMEWASDEYCKSIAQALKMWTSAASYSLWPSLEPWQSREINRNHGFRVSDGFCFGWFRRILAVFVFVGPLMQHAQIWYCRSWGSLWAVCDGLGRLWFFVLQWWEEIRRGRGGLAPCSVCFVCSWSVEASYKRWLCPFVSPDPKWEAFRGRRVARASCLKRRRVLVGWSFIQVLQQGFVSVILDRIFSEVPGVTVCLVFSCAFDAWEMWALLTLYESMALLALRFQLTQLFRHGLGTIFCHGQINLKPIKFQRESWKTMEGHECQNTEVRIWIGHFFVDLDASTNAFRGRHKCSSTMLSTSCRGGPSEPLDRWRMHRTPNVALGAEPVGPSRPIANELGKEAARWKPPCLLHDGTVVQQLNIEPFMV